MSNDQQSAHAGGAGGGGPAGEDFFSLREITAMILRHRRLIAAVVLLTTIAAGVFFLLQPRTYQAEGYLQVIAPVPLEGRVDKDLFETMILSHLQRASSAFLAKSVAASLRAEGIDITPLELDKRIKISRPPKTDLICLRTRGKTEASALMIVRQWIKNYLDSVQRNNIRTALSQVSSQLKKAQTEYMEKQAVVDHIKAQVLLTDPLVTLSRAVDDRQLWTELAAKTPQDPELLKKLAGIHIKGQEHNPAYINLRSMQDNAEQLLSSSAARRDLLLEVDRMLDARVALNGSATAASPASTNAALSEAELYLKLVLKNVEIIQFGEPGLVSASRGALKNTALFFVAMLALMCLGAFVYEWGKGILA